MSNEEALAEERRRVMWELAREIKRADDLMNRDVAYGLFLATLIVRNEYRP